METVHLALAAALPSTPRHGGPSRRPSRGCPASDRRSASPARPRPRRQRSSATRRAGPSSLRSDGEEAGSAGRLVVAAVALGLLAAWSPAAAFEWETGAPGLVLRFDNTFRYNIGVRTGPIDTSIGSSPAFTEGEYCFGQGHLTASRLDLVSELDLSYEARFGGRVSAAGWYDYAYHSGTVNRSPALVAAGVPGTYSGDRFSTYTLHRYRGPWGELLDAFAFAKFDLGDVPVTVKAGRHTIYWGESLLLSGAIHGISYSQSPLDLQKGFATPGVDAKELYRPLTSISVQAQLLPTLSVAGQYFLEWQSYIYPEGGTFLGPVDALFYGPDGVVKAGVALRNAGASQPRQVGNWGVALRYAPDWLDGTLGLYYRWFTDKLASALIAPNPSGPPTQYLQYYGEGIDLVGLSFAKQVAGVSVGAELSYRHGMPLIAPSGLAAVVPSATLEGNTYQARGNTLHVVANATGVLPPTPVFDTASWGMEIIYSRWLAVIHNPGMFFGEGYGQCVSGAKGTQDGCATRDVVGVSAVFVPTWFRVASGIDLLAPLAVSWTIWGNSAVAFGGNQGSGTYSAAIAADVVNRYRFDLRYVDYFGSTVGSGPTLRSNGLLALLQSRGSVTFTAKATF